MPKYERAGSVFSTKSKLKMPAVHLTILALLLVVRLPVDEAQVPAIVGIITPPPQVGNKPTVANGIVYYLNHIPDHCKDPYVSKYPSGGVVQGKRALMRNDSPHRIYGNIEIPASACLYIEPGTELRFGPGFGIIVNGTLIARGSDEQGGRIIMTKDQGEDTGRPSGDWKYDARLSNGNTTRDGRLDLFYQGKWRAICTNYQNFSIDDVNVTCRHLGFLKGNFTYHSFSRNLTNYILWEKPDCHGNENSLFDCPGASKIKIGTHICDGQQVVGFECEGLRPGLALDHWRGVEFLNSSFYMRSMDGNIYRQEVWSWLEYLDILYPGLDSFHGRTSEPGIYYPKAAISASPLVPLMNNVTIMYGAYDAFNLTEIVGPIHIANCTVHKNRGYGIFIQTAVGETLVNMTEVTDNWGDGIKFYISNLTIHDFQKNFTWNMGFCNTNNVVGQSYPIFQHQDIIGPNGEKTSATTCERTFYTNPGKVVNLHFLIMERDPDAFGKLIVKDGGMFGKVLGTFDVFNGSFPQSVYTQSTVMYVQFQYTIPKLLAGQKCKIFEPCIRFLLRVTSTSGEYGPEEEFRLIYSRVSNNVGYGVNLQDIRSKAFFNTSVVSSNQFGAGIRVYQGAGQVIINNTLIENNTDSGINITYSGGYQLFNNTRLIRNHGYGIITEYLKVNHTRIENMQKMEVVRGDFQFNELIGLRVGNYCSGGSVLVNESLFQFCQDEAIEYLSCNMSTALQTNFSVAFTDFISNARHAILMKPILNTVGIITNCSFINHTSGVIRIDNGFDLLISKWYRQFPVEYYIFENKFRQNQGLYVVNIRLTDSTPLHKLFFKFNHLYDNYIQESSTYIKPRNKASAVAVISSGNVYLNRNILNNPNSVREISTHLTDPSVVINAAENYWNIEVTKQSEYEKIHLSIFDQDDRYNLAQISYYPALLTDQVYQNSVSVAPRYVWRFQRTNIIGGLLETGGFIGTSSQTYYVDRDIFVFPGQVFTLQPNAVLKFAPAVGMVVHGCLKADGRNSAGKIQFSMWADPDWLPLENRSATVRLMNGTDLYEGRLEVLIDEEWGTVCNEGWTKENAVVVCQQLGLIYNPDYGTATLRMVAPADTRVLMSWVFCDETDEDLTRCRAIKGTEVGCDHEKDVYLRCQEPTWAGVTLPATSKRGQSCETQLREVLFERAGLFDAATMSFTPALRIDYNFYQITAVTISNSLSDGVLINYIYPFDDVRLEYMQVHDNLGNGVVTRCPRLQLFHSNITHSGKAGFLYDPFFSEYDALSVRSMIHQTRRSILTETPFLSIGDGQMTFLVCSPGTDVENHDYYTEITTNSNSYHIVLQVLDFFPVTEIEAVTVYDSARNNIVPATKMWKIPEDLVDFPIRSNTRVLTIMLRVRGLRSGRLAFAVVSASDATGSPVLMTYVYNTTFSYNFKGMQTKHYNSPSNRRLEIFHRFKLETIQFEQVGILNSLKEAIHMPSVTKFTDDYIPTYEDMTVPERVATIHYNISLAKFADNQYGILAEHNHVDFANNVWQWTIANTYMLRTQNGGVEIEVPRVNDESERLKHSVSITDSVFRDSNNFVFTVAGYYADVTIHNNLFDNNRCKLGLITISGMEKNQTLINNKITNNIGRHMMDINILSHSEYSEPVRGIMLFNEILNNRYEGLDPPGYGNSPKTFAVAFRGVQNMTASRNIFNNPQMGYELIAGITALSLGNPVNVTKNYWGRTDYAGILERIFDFDDWNNYAIADFFPYLTEPQFNSDLSGGEPVKPPLDTSRLGGRVLEDQVLAYKTTPYIVERDLTIMPQATFTISAGTELQFHPNVGILVLGRLVARGVEYNHIKMRPVQSGTAPSTSGRKKRASSATIRLRGDGTLFKNAGFLELYNTSTRSWNLMCDSQVNEKTAEVVCRQLGKETVNVRVRFTYLYDFYIYGKPQYFLKEFWFESYYCRGDEMSLSQCITRYNYNMHQCIQAANYTFITCGERNLKDQEYWGNIRFARETYEEQSLESDFGRQESIMEYVDIEGAGMLHGEKVGAIQTTYVSPTFRYLNITRCVENGFDIIAPRGTINMTRLNVSENLGFAFNFLILNGESTDSESSFLLLGPSTIPYFVYGLVEICRMEKGIVLSTRMILYYKYGPDTRDCVKSISSGSPRNRIGLRFLQLNMFYEDFSRNVVEIFDGHSVSQQNLVGSILANTTEDVLKLYQSTGDTLTVHVHASVGHGSYGFIAEVVHLPFSGLTYPDSNYFHSLSYLIALKNQDGALQYNNIGEVNPSLYIEKCWLEDNGVAILNLTSPPTIDISLQGTRLFRFDSNFVSHNKGGLYMSVNTKSIATALRGNITNNVFAFGTHGEALNITGHYYQNLYIFQNYIFNYTSGDYRDIVHIREVVVNFTFNYLDSNFGHYILTTYNSDNRQARQEYTRSGFLRNNSTALIQSTIKIGKGMPFFENNFLVNDENDFEMETYPKLDDTVAKIDARRNWWGSDQPSYIIGKIWDESDMNSLVGIEYWQALMDNRSVLEGKCLPGWRLDSGRCYRFMGGALPYYQANNFCRSMGAFLAEGKGREGFYNYLLRLTRNANNPADRVWIMSEVGSSRCSAFENTYIVYEEDCWNQLYPFICELDPYIEPPIGLESSVRAMAIGIGAGIGGALVLIFFILGVLWCIKSKRREKERFERTASMRSSMRSIRGTKSNLTMLSEGVSAARLHDIDGHSQASSCDTKTSQRTDRMNGSMSSLQFSSRNWRGAVARGLADRQVTERDYDRERQRERDERWGNQRSDRSYLEDVSNKDNVGKSYEKEESESETDKRSLRDSDEDIFDSDDEEQEEKEKEEPAAKANGNVYENQQPISLARITNPAIKQAHSRDDMYKDDAAGIFSQKSKSLSSFIQSESPEEFPMKSIFLPRRQNLPTPPPTPQSHLLSPAPSLQPTSKTALPQPIMHPIVTQMRQSPAPSEVSQQSRGGWPSPCSRTQLTNSQASLQATPLNSSITPNYENHPEPLSDKLATRFPDPMVSPFSAQSPSSYGQQEPLFMEVSPSNPPRYSLALPVNSLSSYDENDHNISFLSERSLPRAYPPVQVSPKQDMQYMPRNQPYQRRNHGSHEQLVGSQERVGGSRNNLTGSREHLLSSRERLARSTEPDPHSHSVLLNLNDPHLNLNRAAGRSDPIETEI